MSQPPSQPPSPAPAKPKLSAEERRARQADRLKTIRLRMAIGQELDARGITTPAAIGEVLGMEAKDVHDLLNRRQWRAGDVAALQVVASRLGLEVVLPD
jgi:predicted flap endonuclease-1-like 5' DNA nuclease